MSKSKNIDDYDKAKFLYHTINFFFYQLADLYYKEYQRFLQNQQKAELTRQEILNNMADSHEMMSSLKSYFLFICLNF